MFNFFLFVVLLLVVMNLRSRIKTLEETLKNGKITQAPQSVSPGHVQATAQAQDGQASKQTQSPSVPRPRHPGFTERFFSWIKEDWLLKLGALLLLIGFGWLTTYAFLQNWIGPMGRIALGIIAGALFLSLGHWRMQKFQHQGGVFVILGSTIILLTTFAAREIYDFFTPGVALVVMFLSTAYVAFVSVQYKSRSLSLGSLILAAIAPLLTNSPNPSAISLFSYLLVVILGAIWIVVLTGRRELTVAALVIVWAYSLPYLGFFSADKNTLLLFAYVFSVVFFFTNTIGILKLKDKNIIPDLITAAGNGMFLLMWILAAAQDEWKSLIIAAWMVVFSFGAFIIFRISGRKEPFYVYSGVGVAMLIAATAVELAGAAFVIALTVESAVVTMVSYLVMRNIKITHTASLLMALPIFLSSSSIFSRSWRNGIIHKDFFVLLILTAILFGIGLVFYHATQKSDDHQSKTINSLHFILGSIFFYILLWLSLHSLLKNDDTAVTLSLVVYTIVGLVSYFYGLTKERRVLRVYGALLLGFVIFRLFFVDVWKMALAGRIITFFAVGTLLVGTAFLGRKKHGNHNSQIQ